MTANKWGIYANINTHPRSNRLNFTYWCLSYTYYLIRQETVCETRLFTLGVAFTQQAVTNNNRAHAYVRQRDIYKGNQPYRSNWRY